MLNIDLKLSWLRRITKTNFIYVLLFEEDICKFKYLIHFGDDYINKIELRIDNIF